MLFNGAKSLVLGQTGLFLLELLSFYETSTHFHNLLFFFIGSFFAIDSNRRANGSIPTPGIVLFVLSNEPGSSSFYFHQNGYTANGDKLVFSTRSGLSTYDFKTKKIEQIVEGRTSNVIVGRKTRKVFYLKGDTVFETDVDTKATERS